MYNREAQVSDPLVAVSRKALLALWEDRVTWKAFLEQIEEILGPAQNVLDDSEDMKEILHARGKKKALLALIRNIEQIAQEEKDKENE